MPFHIKPVFAFRFARFTLNKRKFDALDRFVKPDPKLWAEYEGFPPLTRREQLDGDWAGFPRIMGQWRNWIQVPELDERGNKTARHIWVPRSLERLQEAAAWSDMNSLVRPITVEVMAAIYRRGIRNLVERQRLNDSVTIEYDAEDADDEPEPAVVDNPFSGPPPSFITGTGDQIREAREARWRANLQSVPRVVAQTYDAEAMHRLYQQSYTTFRTASLDVAATSWQQARNRLLHQGLSTPVAPQPQPTEIETSASPARSEQTGQVVEGSNPPAQSGPQSGEPSS